jgi:hypothetical protein
VNLPKQGEIFRNGRFAIYIDTIQTESSCESSPQGQSGSVFYNPRRRVKIEATIVELALNHLDQKELQSSPMLTAGPIQLTNGDTISLSIEYNPQLKLK